MAAMTIDNSNESDNLQHTQDQLKAVITNLYVLLVQAHDYQGPDTQIAMTEEIKALIQNLITLTQTARQLGTHIPLDVIQYVEGSRNPDIYTRDYVEAVMKKNQEQKGRSEAFASFQEILAAGVVDRIPDMKDDVKKIVEASGSSEGVLEFVDALRAWKPNSISEIGGLRYAEWLVLSCLTREGPPYEVLSM